MPFILWQQLPFTALLDGVGGPRAWQQDAILNRSSVQTLTAQVHVHNATPCSVWNLGVSQPMHVPHQVQSTFNIVQPVTGFLSR